MMLAMLATRDCEFCDHRIRIFDTLALSKICIPRVDSLMCFLLFHNYIAQGYTSDYDAISDKRDRDWRLA
jgi:hypothetical protein